MGQGAGIIVGKSFISAAASLLNDLWDEVCENPDAFNDCKIKSCVDFVLVEKPSQTWPYILMTQLLGKATDENVNILAMHKSSSLPGAWDARSLCEHVISRDGCFEPIALRGVLGGVKQPYNNNPAKNPELSRSNKTSSVHVPIRDAVIDGLSQVETSAEARECLGYFLYVCLQRMNDEILVAESEDEVQRGPVDLASLRETLCALAKQGRDGEGLNVAAATALTCAFRAHDGYVVNLYQSNTSRRGRGYQGDAEIYFGGSERYAAFEFKDKPFSTAEYESAAEEAWGAGFPRFLFVYGFGAGQVSYEVLSTEHLQRQRDEHVFASCVSFEQLLDALLLLFVDLDLEYVRSTMIGLMEDAHVKAPTKNLGRELLRKLLADARE